MVMLINNKDKEREYSLDDLNQDIVKQYKKEKKMDTTDAFRHDRQHNLKVLNYFIAVAQKVNCQSDQEVENVINNELSNDVSLFAYMFFVSSRTQFEYSMSYLLKCWREYAKAIKNISGFILDMIFKTNVLRSNAHKLNADTFVFADLFVLTFKGKKYVPQIKILWDNWDKLLHLDGCYFLSAKKGNAIILAVKCSCGNQQEIKDFLDYLFFKKTIR